ncbi:MAG: helix-hairpin-helix domain-containing protein [Flavobacteriales bacterium]
MVWFFVLSCLLAWSVDQWNETVMNSSFSGMPPQSLNSMDLLSILEDWPQVMSTQSDWEGMDNRRKLAKTNAARRVASHQLFEPFWINALDSAGWDALPWISPWTARRIVNFRNALGGFYDLEQLEKVYHIHDSAVAFIRRFGRVDGGNLKQICADTASWSTLRGHPLIDSDLATRIVRYRVQHALMDPSELALARTITREELEDVLPYLTFCRPSGEAN